MVKNSLFVSGVLLLALCGCSIKYAGSEYSDNKDGLERLQHDQDKRILNSISPLDRPFDARALVVLPSQASIDAESRAKVVLVKSAAKKHGVHEFVPDSFPLSWFSPGVTSNEEYPPSFYLLRRNKLSSMKPEGWWLFKSTPEMDENDIRLSVLNGARERDFELTIEALRRRKIFQEVYVTRSDSSETLSLPKCEVTILLDADMTKQGTMKIGDGKPENIEEKPVEEMPGIKERRGTIGASGFEGTLWDFIEVKRKTAILAWLDQLEKSVGRHLKK